MDFLNSIAVQTLHFKITAQYVDSTSAFDILATREGELKVNQRTTAVYNLPLIPKAFKTW